MARQQLNAPLREYIERVGVVFYERQPAGRDENHPGNPEEDGMIIGTNNGRRQ